MESILRNPKQDWAYIILSTLSGFLILGFYFLLKNGFGLDTQTSFIITLLLFTLLFDVRHFFSTYSRTFLDKHYFRENKSWLLGSTAAIFILPLVVYFILIQGEVTAYNSYIVFVFGRRITLILGFYHLVKQNWGFMAIYKKKFREPEDGSDRWEKMLLLSGSFLPLVYISKRDLTWFLDEGPVFTPNANDMMYIVEFWGKLASGCLVLAMLFLLAGFVLKTRVQYRFVSRNLGFYFLGLFILTRLILGKGSDAVLGALIVALGIVFAVSLLMSVRKAIAYRRFNTGKWAVLISSLVLYNGVLLLPLDIENKMLLVIAITIPHNIQYLTFVNFFSARQYESSDKDHGLARILSQKIILFAGVSLLFALVFELGRLGTGFFAAPDSWLLKNTVAIIFLSFVLHHYYLDAVIWRVRKDQNLSKTLD